MTNQSAIPAAPALLTGVNAPAQDAYQGRMYINGEWSESSDGTRFERRSPAHGHVVSSFPEATPQDVEAAIKAADTAFRHGPWSKLKGVDRARILLAVAEGIKARVEKMSLLESLETGKPLTQARGEVSGCVDLWQYAASLARTISGDAYDSLGEDMLGIVLRQPIGVVGLITPWNFPLWILSQKLPFALAAGCTCIVKPSELTSSTTVMLMEVLEEAGVPAGVVNVVTGKGPTVGQPLAEHPNIDMLSFTGSTRVGSLLGGLATKNLKKVALELGGKNPQIVFPDCDWDAMVDAVVFGVYFNAGECCNSGSRVLVHESIAERFAQAVVERARQVAVGDPLHPDCKVGAIVSENQLGEILGNIGKGVAAGARLRLGGRRYDAKGLYLEPTILSDVTPDMGIARDEIFGPVLVILPFSDAQQAVDIANDTAYGLSAAVWSSDINTCLTVARGVDAGTIWVNTFLDGYPELPFGGFKSSGVGRELGKQAVEDYTETKTIQLHIGERKNWWLPKPTT
ncbi:aldehyde dehydrogenase family protein [Paraburkholderia sp. DHOC27]|uniref:aldehyde dehydrogenase family protein n=1 Tax=Paraburkholderia sp. DHOC27 TaxID=2303330 RepID=UPI000E3C2117|nr:aldehyde dehydrogenase family protein [Paraburkholderia sp. DHOC27]RFU44423.1 aldehyde dehydrogenase family protein [Paraburkholderia sp. DHOC27]